ncbi:MAG: two-component sensor histidine kinase PleC [Rhodospirillales bacterium]|nr:two-component sensor histidine kinase PleC [Rhodospirillales bacterium]
MQRDNEVAEPGGVRIEATQGGLARHLSATRPLLLGLLATCVVIALFLGLELAAEYRRALGEAERATLAAARIGQRQVSQALQHIQLAFQSFDEDPTVTSTLVVRRVNSEQHAALWRIRNSSPLFSRLIVVDTEGKLVASSEQAEPAPISFAERPWFKAQINHVGTGLRFDEPLQIQDGVQAIPVSQRLMTPEGQFAGVLVAYVRPEYFADFFAALSVDSMNLLRIDGNILARHPTLPPGAPTVVPEQDDPEPHGVRGEEWTTRRPSQIDGQPSLLATARVPNTDLVVVARLTQSTVRARWGRDVLPLALSATALLLAFAAVGMWLARSLKRRDVLVHAIVEAQASADTARAEAEAASNAKSNFLAQMSHELRTPLNAILGFAQVLEGEMFGKHGDARYREYSRHIRRSGDHLLQLINNLLDLSKVQSGNWVLDDGPVDLVASADWVLEILGQRATEASLTLVNSIPADFPELHADKRILRQVLLNLVGNAIKFTPAGGHIAIEAARDARGGVALSVRDSGIGIDPDDIPEILTPFGTAKRQATTAAHGTGLGLPLSKAFAELHGGVLEIRPAPGGGTIVTMLLPEARVIEAPPLLIAMG